MGLRSCDWGGCSRPAERTFGSCMICGQHLCYEHVRSEHHLCPTEENDADAYFAAYDKAKEEHLAKLLGRINARELIKVASKLRNGLFCKIPAFDTTVDPSTRNQIVASQMGGQNCHIDIVFEDGVTWIARIRLNDPTLPPQEVQDYIFHSEVATLKFLSATAIPCPEVYYHQVDSPNNLVGAAFILMQKMPGAPLRWDTATGPQRSKVMEQLADILLELEKHPFEATGSLISEKSGGSIGGFSQAPLFSSPESPLGPFTRLDDAYRSFLRIQLDAIVEREVTSLPIDHYLAFRWRLDNIPNLLTSVEVTGPFYLKHYDDKGDHILVDDDFNITAIIDWEFASAEAKSVAFSSPCMMWPVGDYYDGNNTLSKEEVEFSQIFERRNRKDLAQIILESRKFQRFQFFLGGGTSIEQTEFESLFQGLRSSLKKDRNEIQPYPEWRDQALQRYSREDVGLQRLLGYERSLKRAQKEM